MSGSAVEVLTIETPKRIQTGKGTLNGMMSSKSRKSEAVVDCSYNSRLQKGGALFDDMRLLVRNWQNGCEKSQIDAAVLENLLGKRTRSRAWETFRRAFLPRFVKGYPKDAWKIVRELEDRNVSVEVLRPVYYWITAKNERILYDFVCNELRLRSEQQDLRITTNDVIGWLTAQLASCGKAWSETVTTKVARGMLATLRDFGILEGAVIKKIAPVYIPIESFAYIAFAIYQGGVTGANLVNHPDWSLFLFSLPVVERMFLEADRHGLLRYHAAGRIVRIDFLPRNFEEMADVVATRTY